MFCVVYQFTALPAKEQEFRQAWAELTKIIYEHAGSLGSRLHRDSSGNFIAYAQWPDRESWETASGKLPESAKLVSQRMRENCEEISTIYELDMMDDLLKKQTSSDEK